MHVVGIDFKFPFDMESMRIAVCQMFLVFDIDNFCQILIELSIWQQRSEVNSKIILFLFLFQIELFAWHAIILI